MIRHYNANLKNYKTTLKLSYCSGRLFKFEIISGSLTKEQVKNIGQILPPLESDFPDFNKNLENKISYSLIVKDQSTYELFNNAWFSFYMKLKGRKPKFNKIEGNSLKQIIKYLTEVNGTETKALELWKAILSIWGELDEFHRKNTDLKYINSNIMRILSNVERINTETNGAVSDDYLDKISRDLQS
ncbi:conserved hypothetical protein [Tenacibaculum sp. 190524A02b]|uniref:Uncharacterized protein n=1 Tax=Tenacibaculum vairaonense TaxID=3137860 RepID=A0ABP1FCW9_9FLAO